MRIEGQIIDIVNRRIFPGVITIQQHSIQDVQSLERAPQRYIMPGFVDAHVHIESSMLVPSEFARLAVRHGTVATVSDPHEIANVLGTEGVRFMLENARQVPFKFCFGAPSCVPATAFETAGDAIDATAIRQLLAREDIGYLAEMMNYPGVLSGDEEVTAKLRAAQDFGKPVDGHAPGLRGDQARRYAAAGIHTDHECSTLQEAQEKLDAGMHIIIREGSAARNFDALEELIATHPERVMFCSDDKHPDELLRGHINELVARALQKGHDLFNVLRAASLNPAQHYGLSLGLLQVGDPADFIIVEDLETLRVQRTYIAGQLLCEKGETRMGSVPVQPINRFAAREKSVEDFAVAAGAGEIRVIEAEDAALVTGAARAKPLIRKGRVVSDTERDLLKITVVNRYTDTAPAVAFIRGFGLQRGAIAGSVGHDSHNILAVGAEDGSLQQAVNAVVRMRGGLAVTDGHELRTLALPVAGLMHHEDGFAVAKQYAELEAFAKKNTQTQLSAPFMTLSFMALLVIPDLKLSDKGLFSGEAFAHLPLFVQ